MGDWKDPAGQLWKQVARYYLLNPAGTGTKASRNMEEG